MRFLKPNSNKVSSFCQLCTLTWAMILSVSLAAVSPAVAQETAAQDINSLETQLKNTTKRLKELDEQLKNNQARKSVLEKTANSVSKQFVVQRKNIVVLVRKKNKKTKKQKKQMFQSEKI